jgi:hypothetical protein
MMGARGIAFDEAEQRRIGRDAGVAPAIAEAKE